MVTGKPGSRFQRLYDGGRRSCQCRSRATDTRALDMTGDARSRGDRGGCRTFTLAKKAGRT